MPDACIAADVIIGFPGETDEEFLDTFNFIENLDISYLHVFTYSQRPGTKASEMELQVDEKIKGRRSKLLHELSERKKIEFYSKNNGSMQEVLWESDVENDMMFGFTSNYIRCKTRYDKLRVNQIEKVRLEEVDAEGIYSVSQVL